MCTISGLTEGGGGPGNGGEGDQARSCSGEGEHRREVPQLAGHLLPGKQAH